MSSARERQQMNEFSEDQRKHIEIIEATITRMSDNSKQMKEWCVALITGLVGAYAAVKIFWLLIIALLVILLFRHLDAFYLMLERRYRYLYNDVVGIGNEWKPAEKIPLYSMSTEKYKDIVTQKSAVKSPSIRMFYWILFGGMVTLSTLIFFTPQNNEDHKIKIGNDSTSLKIDVNQPLKIKTDEEDILRQNSNKIDSLIIRIDRIEKTMLQERKLDFFSATRGKSKSKYGIVHTTFTRK